MASRSALVRTCRTSRPTSANGFSPAGLRSIAHTTTSTRAPTSRSARVASRTAPPVVMTSSTSVTRRPATSGPSASLQVPYSLAFLRTKSAGSPVRALTIVAIGIPPSSRPPSRSVSAGSRRSICAATRASRAGWDSKRYLSKYSDDTCPDRSVNSPDSRQIASMSRARVGSGVASSMPRSLAAVLATRLQGIAPTIFSRMSALAVSTGAVNLGQGFPDVDGPPSVIAAAVEALGSGANQYAPGVGVPALRQAVARHQQRNYGLQVDPDREVVVTTGATEAIAA